METLETLAGDHRLDQGHDRRQALSHRAERHRGAKQSLWQGRARQSRRTAASASPTGIRASAASSTPPGRSATSRPAPMAGSRRWRWAPRPARSGSSTGARDLRSRISTRSDEPAVYPAFHVLGRLGQGGGVRLSRRAPRAAGRVAALAWREGGRVVLWLANLTPEPVTMRIDGRGKAGRADQRDRRRRLRAGGERACTRSTRCAAVRGRYADARRLCGGAHRLGAGGRLSQSRLSREKRNDGARPQGNGRQARRQNSGISSSNSPRPESAISSNRLDAISSSSTWSIRASASRR